MITFVLSCSYPIITIIHVGHMENIPQTVEDEIARLFLLRFRFSHENVRFTAVCIILPDDM